MIIYKVYGKRFINNKKLALSYHYKIYGNANYQASNCYKYINGELVAIATLSKTRLLWHNI